MKREIKAALKSFAIEFFIYAALVVGYYFLVLHLIGGWLADLFQHDRKLYSFVAVGLIIGQGFLLEILTRLLLAIIKPRVEEE